MKSQDILNLQEAYLSVYDDSYVLNYLLEEGYAETPESAYVIMENMSEDWKSDIKSTIRGAGDVAGATARGLIAGKKTTSTNPLSRAANAASRYARKRIAKSRPAKSVKRFAKYSTLGLLA